MDHSPPLHSKGVLVDCNHVPVLENLNKLRSDGPQVIGHDERGGKHCPKGHLGLGLVNAQREVANDELKVYSMY